MIVGCQPDIHRTSSASRTSPTHHPFGHRCWNRRGNCRSSPSHHCCRQQQPPAACIFVPRPTKAPVVLPPSTATHPLTSTAAAIVSSNHHRPTSFPLSHSRNRRRNGDRRLPPLANYRHHRAASAHVLLRSSRPTEHATRVRWVCNRRTRKREPRCFRLFSSFGSAKHWSRLPLRDRPGRL